MTDFITKDSGDRQDFDTGSRRDTRTGKGRFDLLPYHAIQRLAGLYERGAEKYGDRNWEKGQPLSRYADSMLRHGFQAAAGETDEDHWAAVAWNALGVIDHQERIALGQLPADLDDLPKQEVAGQVELFSALLRGVLDDCCDTECEECTPPDDIDEPHFTYLKFLGHGSQSLSELIESVESLRVELFRQKALGRELSEPVDDGHVYIAGYTADRVEL